MHYGKIRKTNKTKSQDYADVSRLTYRNVDYSTRTLRFEQKTRGRSNHSHVVIPLSDALIELIGYLPDNTNIPGIYISRQAHLSCFYPFLIYIRLSICPHPFIRIHLPDHIILSTRACPNIYFTFAYYLYLNLMIVVLIIGGDIIRIKEERYKNQKFKKKT